MQLNIAKHFGTIHDSRVVSDPWDVGLRVEILRAGHPDWQKWLQENFTDGIAHGMLKETVRLQIERPTKRNEREVDALLDAAAARVVESAKDPGEKSKSFAGLKGGVADVLIRDIPAGLVSPEGEAIPFSREAAHALLDNPIGADGLPVWVPETRLGADGKKEPMPFGGQPLGDAIAAWLLEEATKSEAFFTAYIEGASGN